MARKRVIVNFTESEISDFVNHELFMRDLSIAHNCTKETIKNRLIELCRDDVNEAMRINKINATIKMTDDIFVKVAKDYNENMPMHELCEKYCMTSVCINSNLRKRGVKRRPRMASKVKIKREVSACNYIPKTVFTIPHRMMTISMRQQQCRA